MERRRRRQLRLAQRLKRQQNGDNVMATATTAMTLWRQSEEDCDDDEHDTEDDYMGTT